MAPVDSHNVTELNIDVSSSFELRSCYCVYFFVRILRYENVNLITWVININREEQRFETTVNDC